MLRTSSLIGSSSISQSIDVANEVGESSGNGTNLSNLSTSTKSTKAGYLTSGDTKIGGGHIKKCVKDAKGFNYLTLVAKKAFNHLRHMFTQAPIFQHFDPEWYIQIETDVLGYAISRVLNQLTLDDSGQWHPVAYYLQRIIPAKTQYKTHNSELLAIDEVFKTWRHYLEGCKHKVFVLLDHNKFWQFMDTKNLSSC